tara:strand:- start:96 stop:767 length:672 start_codon:yes stop_codon:yes gene_type:complete
MHRKKNKNILLYFILFIFLGSIHNQILSKNNLLEIKYIKVFGLQDYENEKIIDDLNFLKFKNLYFINQNDIKNILELNNLIESYSVFKQFPSTLIIEIKKAELLANTYKDGTNYLIGSNGKLIKSENKNNQKPFLFGNFKNEEFLKLKNIISKSKLDFKEIKKFYYFDSGRWDIEIENGLLIKLPEKNLIKAINLSKDLITNKKFKNLKVIDIRVKNQVILNE